MSVCGLPFLLWILTAAAVFRVLPGVRSRQLFFFAGSLAFLATLVPDLTSWIATVGLLLTSYGISKWLVSHPSKTVLTIFILVLLSAFLVLKKYAFVTIFLPGDFTQHTVAIVGLSYLLFRIIHVAVDASQNQITDLSLWSYVNYNINLFGLLAGPIQRYQQFQESWNNLTPIARGPSAVLMTVLRIFAGIIKIVLIAAAILQHYDATVVQLKVANDGYQYGSNLNWYKSVYELIEVFYLYPMYIYFNFTGYCDIVIGAARLFGIVMPENFDTPFFSRNLIEYWTRWHRTLGFWIRDYVFNPLYKALVTVSPEHASAWAYLCFFTALFLTGIWHGSTWNFVVFGILNAIGVCAVKFWEKLILNRSGRPGLRTYLASPTIQAVAILTTFHYVCLTMFFFPGDLPDAWALVRAVVGPKIL